MNKSIIIFVAATILSVLIIILTCLFLNQQVGAAVLTEETISGDVIAAENLTVGFRSDSSNSLHWVNAYNFETGNTHTIFRRGDMLIPEEESTEDIRFNGESTIPYSTELEYTELNNLQNKEIHKFYNDIQNNVLESGTEIQGKLNLSEYLDYYPISFRFQFGSKFFSSDDALVGLKILEENEMLTADSMKPYTADIDLYMAFNDFFKIPVIDTEFQEYRVSKLSDYDTKTALGYDIEIKKLDGKSEDYYEFDPIVVLQEENILDGKVWEHPDLSGGLSYIVGGDNSKTSIGRIASEYNLKNRMLFIVNNRTVNGEAIDVSQIKDGYGIYELPIEVRATATVKQTARSVTVPYPNPITDEMKLVFTLNEDAEYVDMSMSKDHRYLAVFSVTEGYYYVEIIDADTWMSSDPIKLFSETDTLTHVWGDDGSLAVTNNYSCVSFFEREVVEKNTSEIVPYRMIYCGEITTDFVNTFFNSNLAVAVNNGKVALVQNPLVGEFEKSIRNAALECAVIDETGLIYHGILKNNIVDMGYDIEEQPQINKHTILPVPVENWVEWS